MRGPGVLWQGEVIVREGILIMEKTILETGRVGQAMVEALFQTEVEAEERGCLSHQDRHLEDNTGREWVILVNCRIKAFGI